MNILFISRATLFSARGGDTVQMEQTAKELQRLGVQVTLRLCNDKHINYKDYDLIHFFNLIRPADILYHIDKSRLPFVVSPVYVAYGVHIRRNAKDVFLSLLGKNTREYIKCIGRAWRNGERIISYKYLLLGHAGSIRYVLKRCRHLLPNSHSEYRRLKADFPAAGTYTVVPNAIDKEVFTDQGRTKSREGLQTVLCAARFEPRKNQLHVIESLAGAPYQLIFAGDVAPNHREYYEACRRSAGKDVQFTGWHSGAELAALYRNADVHVLASWFETTGLSSLEAAACGCNIVISRKGDTEEYFGEHAFYCDPGDPYSIRAAVDRAMQAPYDAAFGERIKEYYHWSVAAVETLKVYQNVLGS